MSDSSQRNDLEPRQELLEVVRALQANLSWLRESGVRELAGPPLPAKAFSTRAQSAAVQRQPAEEGTPIAEGERAVVASSLSSFLQRKRSGGLFAPAPATSAAPAAPPFAPEGSTLEQVRAKLGECTRCRLGSGRTKLVFGAGNPEAELLFVGEGPGEEEDLQGLPFVGKAGALLTKMIEAMGLSRERVYICNVVKCRPPGNRNPEPDEIAACEPVLRAQIAAVKPKVIVALGKFAAQTLLRESTPITRLRGSFREYCGVPLMPTFHPAYLLRNPAEKRAAWEDLQQVMERLGLGRGGGD